ncbi:Stringent starvation protein B [hydrothermal vent metagenome]|uniref:Stringent starvation protein B n=1 Tax=hydrothermal vent metagenome TaxID=652676 RepID=A0A3B0YVW6_9ZZZZ
MEMTPSKPYLIRAIHEWIVDNDLTPHILVNAMVPDIVVPEKYIENGRIILNINGSAVRSLELGNEWIQFDARFDGQSMTVSVPVGAVLAIYARENGQGMVLEEEEDDLPTPPPEKKPDRSHLTVVK